MKEPAKELDIYNVICRDIPENYEILVRLENGAGYVQIRHYLRRNPTTFEMVPFDPDMEYYPTIESQLALALELCKLHPMDKNINTGINTDRSFEV
jgi:hypothetical protein